MAFLLCLLTCSVYIGSAIYTPSIPGIEEQFGVGQIVATLGLSLFSTSFISCALRKLRALVSFWIRNLPEDRKSVV